MAAAGSCKTWFYLLFLQKGLYFSIGSEIAGRNADSVSKDSFFQWNSRGFQIPQQKSNEFRISLMPDVTYHMLRILTPWCQNPYHKVPVSLLNYVLLP